MVFVEDAAKDTLSPYGRVDRHDHARVVVGRPLIPALMWTMPVEVPFASGQYGASGGTIDEVQELLGHASLSSTEVYLHPDPGRLRTAVDRVPSPRELTETLR